MAVQTRTFLKDENTDFTNILDSAVIKGDADEYRYGNTAGADIADDTDALALDSTAFGRTFLCLLDGAAKTVANSIVRPGASVDQFRPADANNTLTITGANTNSYFGLGSSIFVQVVAAGEYFIDVDGRPIGSSNDAVAFTTA
jgi:hypothetical protein